MYSIYIYINIYIDTLCIRSIYCIYHTTHLPYPYCTPTGPARRWRTGWCGARWPGAFPHRARAGTLGASASTSWVSGIKHEMLYCMYIVVYIWNYSVLLLILHTHTHTHIYSTVQVLSIGSPTKTTRSRSLSPAPGHRGFSFSRETLGRLDSPGAAYSPASPLNTMNLNNTGKFSVK